MRHFIDLLSFTTLELSRLLDLAARLKHDLGQGKRPALLPGKVLGLIFEKPSLRTRVSFEAAMAHLGGSNIFLSATDGPIGQRESIPDYARTMSQFVDGVVLRTFEHRTIEMFAEHATVPVINGLSDFNHPAQALADILTMQECLEIWKDAPSSSWETATMWRVAWRSVAPALACILSWRPPRNMDSPPTF